jgi:hypothetical protein
VIDTVILHTPGSEAYARALAGACKGRAPVRACASGGPPLSVGAHLLLIGVMSSSPDEADAEQQVIATLADQSVAAVLLAAPGRAPPRDAAALNLPTLTASGDAVADAVMLDAALRDLGRSVVFGGAERGAFAIVGRPRAPKLDDRIAGARVEPQADPDWGPENADPAIDPETTKRKRTMGYALGLGLGVLAVVVLLAPWAAEILRGPPP